MTSPLHMHLRSNADRTIAKPAVTGQDGIVVSQHRLASQVGAEVLRDGGNAVDAAIATSFAIGTVEPWMSGLGGVGGMLIAPPDTGPAGDEIVALDFNTRSPRALDPADYPIVEGTDNDLFGWPNVKEGRNLRGASAVLTPSLVAGLAQAHARYGRLAWARLVEPAIELARYGVEVSWFSTTIIASNAAMLAQDPASAAWFMPGGQIPAPQRAHPDRPRLRLPNPALAETLAQIAKGGPRALYQGDLARAIVADLTAAGGCMSLADLEDASAIVVTPRRLAYRNHTVHTLPELNGGVTMLAALRHLTGLLPDPGPHPGAQTYLAYAEALFAAFEERFAALGDDEKGRDPSCTTHICVIDRDGAMVSLTQTLLSLFGARLTLPSTGILMNNGINWFDPRPYGPNALGPNKRPLQNFCPCFLTGPETILAMGGAGGRRIVPMVMQNLSLMVDYRLSLDQAIDHAKIDVSGDPWITAQPELGASILSALAARYQVITGERDAFPYHYALASAVHRSPLGHAGKTEATQPWSAAVAESCL